MISKSIMKPRVRLLMRHPFYASLLLKLKMVEDRNIPTACVDGVTLTINPDWFDTLSFDERIFILAHEVLHVAFLHHLRRGARNPMVWNLACDYAINPILVDGGLSMPKGRDEGLLDRRFDGMGVEAIYNILYKEMKDEGGSEDNEWQAGDGFSAGFGDVGDFPDVNDKAAALQEEQNQKQNLVAAHAIAKKQGKAPVGMERLVSQILNPRVEWESYLAQWVSEKVRDDYTWTKPNRRYSHLGVYLPSLESETYAEIACYFDSSCSMGQKEIDITASEITAVGSLVRTMFHVVYCDSKVAGYQCFEPDDEIELKVKGGGGTDFRPPFAFAEKEGFADEIKAALYFTDGECNSFPEEPEYPVLWLITPNRWINYEKQNFKPPFGDVVYIEF